LVEIEIKIKINNPAGLHSALLGAGAHLAKERTAEENILYDFRSGVLYEKRVALRLRRAGKKTFLTFKGMPQKSRRFKIRQEFETEVKNEKQMKRILAGLGMVPVYRYKKFRTGYRTNRLRISVDETAAGCYLELEGQRSDIAKFARMLGFAPADWIKLDYPQIFQEKGKKS
jgi:adenylate cyclase class 2